MCITWRGFRGNDAPEHLIMGEKMLPLLEELHVPTRVLSEHFEEDIDWAVHKMEQRSLPAAVILKKGMVG